MSDPRLDGLVRYAQVVGDEARRGVRSEIDRLGAANVLELLAYSLNSHAAQLRHLGEGGSDLVLNFETLLRVMRCVEMSGLGKTAMAH